MASPPLSKRYPASKLLDSKWSSSVTSPSSLATPNTKIYGCQAKIARDPFAPMCDAPRNHKNRRMKLVRHVSFEDCPGHDMMMATMLNGAATMYGALQLWWFRK